MIHSIYRTQNLRKWFAAMSLMVPLWAQSAATVPEPAAQGVAIGSSGFNDMMAKQVKPGTFTTEAKEDGSFLLTNTMQTVSAKISPDGVVFDSIGNSAGKGGFALQLTQWGRDAHLQPAASSKIYRDGDAVIHTHAGGIAEKFTNTSGGIQQDFIVPVKPEGNGDLHVQLQVNGAQVSAKDSGAEIALVSGRKLTYDRLAVTDKNGKTIPAQIHVEKNNTIVVSVNDAGAQYPLIIDPTVGDANWVSMGTGINGNVYAVAVNGTDVYVGGAFTGIGSPGTDNIAKWNGSSWSAVGGGLVGTVRALLFTGGQLFAGGDKFTNPTVSSTVAIWNGSAWSGLPSGIANINSGINPRIYALAVDESGTVYAGGQNSYENLYSWNGSIWTTMGTGNAGKVTALAYDTVSGSLYIGGNFVSFSGVGFGGTGSNGLARWKKSGGWQTPWPGGSLSTGASVAALTVDGSGNVFAGGNFSSIAGVTATDVAKWNGSTWSGLGAGTSVVTALALDGTGGLFASTTTGLSKWNGSSWSGISGSPTSLNALAFSGSVLYAGGASSGFALATWDGTNWNFTDQGRGLNGAVYAATTDLNGSLYVGGAFSNAGNVSSPYLAKWNGSIWSSLGSGVDNAVYALAMDSVGNLYAAGDFVHAGGVTVNRIAKWNGAAWSGVGGGVDGRVYALAVGSNGVLYAGGDFPNAGGNFANRVAKWNGSAWSALGAGANNTVKALALNSQGTLYIGGKFTSTYDGSANTIANTNYIAKWSSGAWSSLGTGANNEVDSLLSDTAGNLYAGGIFTQMNGVTVNMVAKWNGTAWQALGSGVDFFGYALALDPAGRLYAAGGAGSVIKRWDGVAWSALGTPPNAGVYALASTSTGDIYVGGTFTSVGGKYSNYLAKWVVPDSDADGVNDLFDAFSNNAAATTDADHDGLPDFWLQPNAYGCSPAAITCNGLTLDTTPPPMILNSSYKGSSISQSKTLQ